MSEYGPTHNEIDDYIAELTEAEREDLATADAATELAILLYNARETRGLTQSEAARCADLRQQAVSRFEQPDVKLANTKLETLRKYLTALDYVVGLSIRDVHSGVLVKEISLPPGSRVGVDTFSRPAFYGSGHRVFDNLDTSAQRYVVDAVRAGTFSFGAGDITSFGGDVVGGWQSSKAPYFFNTYVGNASKNEIYPQSRGGITLNEGLSESMMSTERPGNVRQKTAA